jgi:hypothetical protein
MKYQEEYIKLSDRISWNDKSLVSDLLERNKDLDITYKDGKFFIMAVEDNNIEIVKILLDYFNYNQLVKYTTGSVEYLLSKNKLKDILEIAIEDVNLSQEMKEVLSPYIDFEGSEHNTLNDSFSDIDQTTFIQNVDKDTASNNFLNKEVLKKFEAEQNSQTKIIENLLGFGTEEIHPQIEEHNTTTNVVLSGNNTHEVY